MVKVGIVGGTGYTGVELLRLLASHEEAEVVAITSRAESGRRLDDLYPNLRGIYDLAFSEPDVQALAACDVVFFATPHNVAMNLVPELLAAGARVVDLSADYRIRDADIGADCRRQSGGLPRLLPHVGAAGLYSPAGQGAGRSRTPDRQFSFRRERRRAPGQGGQPAH
jgi:N-acetyl-gamma-glutamyl-phosphate reductase